MRIAVLGTGMVGRAIAARLAELGHEVAVGTRDLAETMGRTEPDGMGNPPFPMWAQAHPQVTVATFADAVSASEMVVNATAGAASISALTAAGEQRLSGKVLIDISNPLDFSQGMPPSLFVVNTDSLGEQIQRAFQQTKVVKALNMVNAYLMVGPKQLAGGDHSTFVSGNDADAKAQVTELLRSFGHTDIIDLGDITTARGTEMMLAVWLRLWGALNTPMFAFKIVR
jgi:8-hydroxy-5-deazaflavin:NADPH oxidoreductase